MICINKNIDHNIERHYGNELSKNLYLQHILIDEIFFKEKIKHCLSLNETNFFYDEISNEYGSPVNTLNYKFLNTSTFSSFFITNNVDIPKCFIGSFSLKRNVNEIFLLKFNNYFMRNGDRYKSFKFLSKTLIFLENELKTNVLNNQWKEVFILTNYLFLTKNYYQPHSLSPEILNFSHKFNSTSKIIENTNNIQNILYNNLVKLAPLFSFYIYKVDKKIYKNTRGKSGKYTFIWKYVTNYKRLFLVMHWIMKELRLKPGKTLLERLNLTFKTLLLNYEQTWMWRIKKFSHNYVYRNCRRTLAETYRTVTK